MDAYVDDISDLFRFSDGVRDFEADSSMVGHLPEFCPYPIASTLCKYPKLYGINKKLARTSFFIYALHPFKLSYVISAFNKMSIIGDKVFSMSDSWYMMTFNYLASPFVCILLCIAIYWFLQKYLPSFLGVIVGERKK